MRRKTIIGVVTGLLIALCGMLLIYFTAVQTPETLGTESRNIYIGDILTLDITAEDLTQQELIERFSDFEVVEFQQAGSHYQISLRTFEPGEYKVRLRNKEVVIQVSSTLTDIDRDDVFEGSTQIIKAESPSYWPALFYIAAGVFLITSIMALVKIMFKKRAKPLTPEELFFQKASTLAVESDSYFVDLTYLFKQYIECAYHCQIIGKTSAEIVSELGQIKALQAILPEIENWLVTCDRYKFSGVPIANTQKQDLYTALVDLIKRLSQQRLDAQKEGAGRCAL